MNKSLWSVEDVCLEREKDKKKEEEEEREASLNRLGGFCTVTQLMYEPIQTKIPQYAHGG